jgi:integrase
MTRNHHPENERIKRRYLIHLKDARGFSEQSLDQVAMAIDRYQTYSKFADLRNFHVEKVKAFKEQLVEQVSKRTHERLSHATVYAILKALRAFHEWLAGQRGYKRHFAFGDWEYFNPSGITASVAKANRPSQAPTAEQIARVLASMPAITEIERRDRALIAFTFVTGARCAALASFRLRHIDIERRVVVQDARAVKTKFSKTFETWFFPVGEHIEQIVIDWVRFLVEEQHFGPDDPLFPAPQMAVGQSGHFEAVGVSRDPWSTTGPIREVFRRAFKRAGLRYSNPHSFRKTIVAIGRKVCGRDLERMQAWAQNLGHESLTTTFGSYGKVGADEQGELVRGTGKLAGLPERARIDRLEEVLADLHARELNRASNCHSETRDPSVLSH